MLLTQSSKKSFRRDSAEPLAYVDDAYQSAHNVDAELADHVRDRIDQLGYSQLRHIRIEANHGRVALIGVLNRYYLRQLAQAAALQVKGVTELITDIEVVSADPLLASGED